MSLRSVLDYAAWAMVAAGSSSDVLDSPASSRVQFPIVVGADRRSRPAHEVFTAKLTSQLPGVASRLVDVVENYQPYKAGDVADQHGLAVLMEMSNREKHRRTNVLVAGRAELILAEEWAITRIVDAQLMTGDERRLAVEAVAGEHMLFESVVHKFGARQIGPDPQAEAILPSELRLIVDDVRRDNLEDVSGLLVEVTSDLLTQLINA